MLASSSSTKQSGACDAPTSGMPPELAVAGAPARATRSSTSVIQSRYDDCLGAITYGNLLNMSFARDLRAFLAWQSGPGSNGLLGANALFTLRIAPSAQLDGPPLIRRIDH